MPRDDLTPRVPQAPAPPAARLADVSVRRGGRAILDGVSTRLTARGVTALIGPNGAGKTTFLKVLNGLIAPDRGAALWGEDGAAPKAVAQAMLLQQPVLLRRTAAANLVFAARRAGIPKSARADLIAYWLERASLTGRADAPARRLSGGEQRRLALVRALMLRPQALLLDEPGAGLDPSALRKLEALIAEAAEAGVKVIFSSHDLGQVRRLADELLFLNAGRLDAAGPAGALLDDPPAETLRRFLKGELL
ncbi:MAG: ATP-binding cassette domain-containing protein [Marivibrio sp.]|uniref:ATP-binding cassette domain-containing protein n=1 Tax=Marivibrio sp. TaxID=2039719 RepID=UPI0032EF59D6